MNFTKIHISITEEDLVREKPRKKKYEDRIAEAAENVLSEQEKQEEDEAETKTVETVREKNILSITDT